MADPRPERIRFAFEHGRDALRHPYLRRSFAIEGSLNRSLVAARSRGQVANVDMPHLHLVGQTPTTICNSPSSCFIHRHPRVRYRHSTLTHSGLGLPCFWHIWRCRLDHMPIDLPTAGAQSPESVGSEHLMVKPGQVDRIIQRGDDV